ncbi:Endonuclease/exonuclease/phosphatase, partial [Irpex rosettiformis]
MRDEPDNAPTPPGTAPTKKKRRGDKKSAAQLRIATLNMKGRGDLREGSPNGKWLMINQIMRERKLAVLAVQETHLEQSHVDDIHRLFGKRIQIFHSEPASGASNSKGVAFVINKERLHIEGISAESVVPGRAQLLTLKWHKKVLLRILNVYAPNNIDENAQFWEDLEEEWNNNDRPLPHIMMGDFNVVEDAIDRFPSRTDSPRATDSLQSLYSTLGLVDGWRERYPTTKSYTYMQKNCKAMSRLDRIYLTETHMQAATEWNKSTIECLNTDHLMVSVSISDREIPFIGKGRWTIPKAVLLDSSFLKDLKKEGSKLMDQLKGITPETRSSSRNAQTLFNAFKHEIIIPKAHDLAKKMIPKIIRNIAKLEKQREGIVKKAQEGKERATAKKIARIQNRIRSLEAKRFSKARSTVARNDWAFGEQINSQWIKNN